MVLTRELGKLEQSIWEKTSDLLQAIESQLTWKLKNKNDANSKVGKISDAFKEKKVNFLSSSGSRKRQQDPDTRVRTQRQT